MKRFKNILYVADSSGIVLKAFHHAVDLAVRNDARLTVILVMERIPPYLTRLTPYLLQQARIEELEAALDKLIEWAASRMKIEAKIVEGKPFLEIVRDVLRNERDLVIKSTDHGDGAMDWLFTSTDMHLLRKCPCPVWLIKASEPAPIRRILACVDFNDPDSPDAATAETLNRMILEMAGALADVQGSECHIVHAWEAIGEQIMRSGHTAIDDEQTEAYIEQVRREHQGWLDRLLSQMRRWIGAETYDAVTPKTHMPKGNPSKVIPALARDLNIDLVVMGTVARTGVPGFLIGNTAESVLNRIRCSVLAVKPPDFVTPVSLED